MPTKIDKGLTVSYEYFPGLKAVWDVSNLGVQMALNIQKYEVGIPDLYCYQTEFHLVDVPLPKQVLDDNHCKSIPMLDQSCPAINI